MAELAYLQVSRVCNQKCLFCSNPANGRVISWAEAARWIDSFAKDRAAGVILTGGEPTMFPGLARLVAYAVKRRLAPRLITNGQKTAERGYLRRLARAGLRHMHISIYSCRAAVQGRLTGNPESLDNIRRSLVQACELGIRVDVNTVISKANAGHLRELVGWVTDLAPQVRHFVWNNLDPLMNEGSAANDLVPRLRDFEVELHKAMTWLASTGRSFRVERVPLCFMSEFPHRSTETRKLIKDEGRRIYFLDEKGLRVQDHNAWTYKKGARCAQCRLERLCAGLYQLGVYYSEAELCPVFTDPAEVARRVREDS
ncbi:MAG: radical SAM protein [Elusimicrobia bacterium]|nr:radical SAM protein [Elusimicrobiota bacterium]